MNDMWYEDPIFIWGQAKGEPRADRRISPELCDKPTGRHILTMASSRPTRKPLRGLRSALRRLLSTLKGL